MRRYHLFLSLVGALLCSLSITFNICIHLDGIGNSHVETISLNDEVREIHIDFNNILKGKYKGEVKLKQADYIYTNRFPENIYIKEFNLRFDKSFLNIKGDTHRSVLTSVILQI